MNRKLFSLGSICFILLFFITGFVYAQEDRPIVRVVYRSIYGNPLRPDAEAEIDALIKETQRFFADEMERHGFGRKTFQIETDVSGNTVVHRGELDDLDKGFLVYMVESSQFGGFAQGRVAHIHDWGWKVIAHELGHTFGLGHDFRAGSDNYIMSYGSQIKPQLSKCAAEWLDVHRAFNPGRSTENEPIKIVMLPPTLDSPPNAIRLRFKVTDLDGLHQVQLLTGEELLSCKSLNGSTNTTVEFVTSGLTPNNRLVSLRAIDVHGNITWSHSFPIDITPLLPRSETISIPDPHLAAAVQREIGNATTTHTILNLRNLDAPNSGITDLTGLEHAHNLSFLNLGAEYIEGKGNVNSNTVSNLQPLSGLTNLISLRLQNNNISDISALSTLKNLTQLYLYNNNISDISALSTLKNLHTLWLYNNNISDISTLSALKNLTQLYLYNNNISDISALLTLKNLHTLWLYNNNISDISALSTLKNLHTLWLYNNNISDISALSTLKNLHMLYLHSNNISDISALSTLKNLHTLWLQDNNISDISALSALKNLTLLWLQDNNISDISPLLALHLTGTEWDSTGLSLQYNPLSYTSINTHIPAMQAKGIEIGYDQRTPTKLLKVSGDAQQAVTNSEVPLPFVVQVQDQRNRAFAEVPVTFSITKGSGKLSTLTTTTDTKGRAKTRLTLGQIEGETTIRVTAAEISQPIQFTVKAILPTSFVRLPDTNLTAKIAETLGKPTDASMTAADMLTLTSLTANNTNISNLTGLQHASNLTTLTLDGNNLFTIDLLTGLTQLTTLSLDNNKLSNIAPLVELAQLETLSLENNNLSDIASLVELTKLKTLRLRGNLLSYPSLYTTIPTLRSSGVNVVVDTRTPTTLINIPGTPGVAGEARQVLVQVQDQNGIAFAGVPVTFTLTAADGHLSTSEATSNRNGEAITTLTLGPKPGENVVSATVTEIQQPLTFTITTIDENTLVHIPDVNLRAKIAETLNKPKNATLNAGDVSALTRLDARNANIQDLTGIEYAHNLTSLNLSGEYIAGEGTVNSNTISDFSPIAGLTRLTQLNLSRCGLSDASFVSGLTQLTWLDLGHNTISDISPLAKLIQLNQLFLSNNTISDVSPLANLKKLTYLFLDGNSISDISPLAKLTQLTDLGLGNNTISDVSRLAELTQLTLLALYNNTISDISPLAKLTQLNRLWLWNNIISDVSPVVGLNLTGTSWSSTGLHISANPLSYASINTHIPAMQAKGIEVKFDNRAHSVLVKISEDTREGEAHTTLIRPFVVEALDEHGATITGRSVTFRVSEGNGKLSVTNAITDAEGRAQTTLTLGPDPGVIKIRVTAAQITYPVIFTVIVTEATRLAVDVNGDGIVNIQDLVLVSSNLGQTGENRADVNGDGVVNIQDLVRVAGALGQGTAASPSLHASDLEGLTAADIRQMLTQAQQLALTDPAYLRGIAVLEQLLARLLPKETALLPNYPNPFNPETWIPYQLAKPAEVTLHIYAVNGRLVRVLALGHQSAGRYQTRSRAAYWDGRNALGESVASGVYFYTLTAGDFTATRKMLIRK